MQMHSTWTTKRHYQVIGLVNSREIIDNSSEIKLTDDNDEAGGEEDTDDNTNNFQTSTTTTTASTAFEEINKTKQPRRIITNMSTFVRTPYIRKE